jgi:dihydroneopterin aldolase/2-amino-4-hydroxy-6-hydroxymethyldihydropteridine diphosphokinase/dihydropteroate synthase
MADYPAQSAAADGTIHALIAVGSNIGDRLGHINKALQELNDTDGIALGKVSRLYESLPMYVEDQDRFMNGCVMVSSSEITLTTA